MRIIHRLIFELYNMVSKWALWSADCVIKQAMKEFLQNLKHVKDVYQVAGFFNMVLLVKTQQHSLFIEEVYNPIVNSKLIQEIQANIVIHSNRKN